jgi:hypothetical protein
MKTQTAAGDVAQWYMSWVQSSTKRKKTTKKQPPYNPNSLLYTNLLI